MQPVLMSELPVSRSSKHRKDFVISDIKLLQKTARLTRQEMAHTISKTSFNATESKKRQTFS